MKLSWRLKLSESSQRKGCFCCNMLTQASYKLEDHDAPCQSWLFYYRTGLTLSRNKLLGAGAQCWGAALSGWVPVYLHFLGLSSISLSYSHASSSSWRRRCSEKKWTMSRNLQYSSRYFQFWMMSQKSPPFPEASCECLLIRIPSLSPLTFLVHLLFLSILYYLTFLLINYFFIMSFFLSFHVWTNERWTVGATFS